MMNAGKLNMHAFLPNYKIYSCTRTHCSLAQFYNREQNVTVNRVNWKSASADRSIYWCHCIRSNECLLVFLWNIRKIQFKTLQIESAMKLTVEYIMTVMPTFLSIIITFWILPLPFSPPVALMVVLGPQPLVK